MCCVSGKLVYESVHFIGCPEELFALLLRLLNSRLAGHIGQSRHAFVAVFVLVITRKDIFAIMPSLQESELFVIEDDIVAFYTQLQEKVLVSGIIVVLLMECQIAWVR